MKKVTLSNLLHPCNFYFQSEQAEIPLFHLSSCFLMLICSSEAFACPCFLWDIIASYLKTYLQSSGAVQKRFCQNVTYIEQHARESRLLRDAGYKNSAYDIQKWSLVFVIIGLTAGQILNFISWSQMVLKANVRALLNELTLLLVRKSQVVLFSFLVVFFFFFSFKVLLYDIFPV